MKHRREKDKYVIIFESGEEIISTLASFAEQNQIKGGFFSGLGAGKDFQLGYYNVDRGNYTGITFNEEMEIISLTGDITWTENGPYPHCHICLSDREMQTRAGHLFKGYVTGTCEMILFPTENKLIREPVPGTDLKLIRL